MLVFISWSGHRSLYVAQALRSWLKDVMQVLNPWVSSEDIRQGARWSLEVARKLEEARFGIVCITRENVAAPWVLFECGALAKALDQSSVCPYLVDVKPTELDGPLVQFQTAQSTESDTRKLVQSINRALGERALPEGHVNRAFRKWWPDLESALRSIPESRVHNVNLRSDHEMLEEILTRIRLINFNDTLSNTIDTLSNTITSRHARSLASFDDLFNGYDIDDLLAKVDTLGNEEDPNALVWPGERIRHTAHELDGIWSTPWNGGRSKDDWVTGIGRVQVYGDYLYVLTSDGLSDCLIATRRLIDDRLAGRYINLGMPREVLSWAGRIVHKGRIDGCWSQGRWDLRRPDHL
jgi:hypothetical protein